jgi:hypothetical protein
VHEGGGLQGVSVALGTQLSCGQLPQFGIDQSQQCPQRLAIAAIPVFEQGSDVVCRAFRAAGPWIIHGIEPACLALGGA